MLPVCNRRYHDQALMDEADTHGDTVIVMDDGERGWHDRFAAFAGHKRRAASMLSFNDYAIVVQAALLGARDRAWAGLTWFRTGLRKVRWCLRSRSCW